MTVELQRYHELTNDAWRYFRKYAEQIPMTDEAWSAAVEELNEILVKHDGTQRMTRRTMMGVIDELEHLDREVKRQE